MRRTGEILSRVNDAAKIRMMISSVPLSPAVDSLMLILSSLMMFLYSWQLAVFALAFVPMWGGIAVLLLAPIRKTHRAMMEENADLESHLVSSVTGISTVRSSYYIILAVLVAAILWAYFSVVEISVHAQGVVRPVSGVHAVQSSVGGYVERLFVRENEYVRKGDTLAILEAASVQERSALVRIKIRHLREELEDVRALAELRQNHTFHFPTFGRERELALQERALREQELTTAEQKMQRSGDLYAKNFVSREEHEQAQMQVEQRSHAVKQSLQTLQRSALEREKQLLARLQEEETTLAELGIEAGLRVLRAPSDGFVTQLTAKAHRCLFPRPCRCV
jgi:multidrug efflux pump subunit AcrA (membrane-fusion protein)